MFSQLDSKIFYGNKVDSEGLVSQYCLRITLTLVFSETGSGMSQEHCLNIMSFDDYQISFSDVCCQKNPASSYVFRWPDFATFNNCTEMLFKYFHKLFYKKKIMAVSSWSYHP